eukprot:447566-Amphidinium_carterae.1
MALMNLAKYMPSGKKRVRLEKAIDEIAQQQECIHTGMHDNRDAGLGLHGLEDLTFDVQSSSILGGPRTPGSGKTANLHHRSLLGLFCSPEIANLLDHLKVTLLTQSVTKPHTGRVERARVGNCIGAGMSQKIPRKEAENCSHDSDVNMKR